MSVDDGNARTRRRYGRTCRIDDFAVFDRTEYLQTFALGLFFFASDKRHDIVDHVEGRHAGVARPAGRLQRRHDHALNRIARPNEGVDRHHIGLQRTVRLYDDKALVPAVVPFLKRDHVEVRPVDFRHEHGYVARPAVCTRV